LYSSGGSLADDRSLSEGPRGDQKEREAGDRDGALAAFGAGPEASSVGHGAA
jgi:hypothetical protein